MTEIPEPIYFSDSELHVFLKSLSFSDYLNPLNTIEAKRAFLSGKQVPPFSYKPLLRADEYLYRLDDIRLQIDHPLATLLNNKIDETQHFIYALRDRTSESFDVLARHNDWYVEEKDTQTLKTKTNREPIDQSPLSLIDALNEALIERDLKAWTIRTNTVMSARVQVNGSRREIIVNPNAMFRKEDIQRLIVHEIDVHAQRSENGRHQSLKCFSNGLSGSLLTEEGLAMLAEEINHLQSPGTIARQNQVLRGIQLAQHMGFRELYQTLRKDCGTNLAWSICLRLKRGLAQPGQAGVYAKDSVYLNGYNRIKKWLKDGGDIRHLYVGEVGIHHPVKLWIEEGWVKLQNTPEFWLLVDLDTI